MSGVLVLGILSRSPTQNATAKKPKQIETLAHPEASRKDIPRAGHQSVMREDEQSPIRMA